VLDKTTSKTVPAKMAFEHSKSQLISTREDQRKRRDVSVCCAAGLENEMK